MRRLALLLALSFIFHRQLPAETPTYTVAWSHYVGWEPWGYAEKTGLLKKWAAKQGISIKLVRVDDYVQSIEQYTAGKFQACTMTNMDALTLPALGGVDSTVLIVGDFSNGNDGIVMKRGKSVADLKGRKVRLVKGSVSHYLLARALELNKMKEKDLSLVDTPDSKIGAAFAAEADGATVTWNPILAEAAKQPGASVVFDSAQVPGEIIDLMVVRSDAPESLKRALTGAWFAALAEMAEGKESKVLAAMAQGAGVPVGEFKAQLKTTAMFYKPVTAEAFSRGPLVKKTMDYVRDFSFSRGLYGPGAKSKDLVGIQFPDGSVLGDKANVKLRFDSKFMKLAADGKL